MGLPEVPGSAMLPGMPRTLDVAILPAETVAAEADLFIVVDALRATTTIATLFAAGLRDLLVVNDIGVARQRAAAERRLLFGEVGGLQPEGFDYGNSPLEAASAPVQGRGAVLFTTNGTAALCAVAGVGMAVTGSLANVLAVATHALTFERTVVVCAGNAGGGRFSLEDFAVAGAICRAILEADLVTHAGDAANLAVGLNTAAAVSGSEHAALLRELGLEADIEFALQTDTSRAVPLVSACGDGWALLTDAATT
jgi:2-phosphosulfolactate phosphatase